jgi:hypothetical protein
VVQAVAGLETAALVVLEQRVRDLLDQDLMDRLGHTHEVAAAAVPEALLSISTVV